MNDASINAKIQALISQRDDALNRYVNLCGELAERDARIRELESKVIRLEASLKECAPENYAKE